MNNDTEIRLRFWRDGATQSERLVAALLRLDGYSNVEPQAPIGGPDGRKDVLCDRGNAKCVAASYFPTKEKSFNAINKKFLHDLVGATTYKCSVFVFFTNQALTLKQRDILIKQADAKSISAVIYDIERIRSILDSPEGYGARVSFLRIPLSQEEQLTFFANREATLEGLVKEHKIELQKLNIVVGQIAESHRESNIKLAEISRQLPTENLAARIIDPLIFGDVRTEIQQIPITNDLRPEFLLFVHRLVCSELEPRYVGQFRTSRIVISGSIHQPCPPSEVRQRVELICKEWRDSIALPEKKDAIVSAIARFFHGVLFIHPFSDGNGRTARAILMQQCLDRFGVASMSRFDRGMRYYQALEAADRGNFTALEEMILNVIES